MTTVEQVCEGLGIRKVELAREMEVAPKTVSKWVKAGSVPRPVECWWLSEKRLRDLKYALRVLGNG